MIRTAAAPRADPGAPQCRSREASGTHRSCNRSAIRGDALHTIATTVDESRYESDARRTAAPDPGGRGGASGSVVGLRTDPALSAARLSSCTARQRRRELPRYCGRRPLPLARGSRLAADTHMARGRGPAHRGLPGADTRTATVAEAHRAAL